jgi:transcriptional regulator with XRE-family HTH domain
MPEAGICVACRTARQPGRNGKVSGDALCPGCMRAAREMVPRPLWLFDSMLMRRVTAEVNIAAMVAVFRAASGLSQQDVGVLTGWGGQPTVSSYEHGRRDVVRLIDMVQQFADAVDMPPGAMMPLFYRHPAVALPDRRVLEVLGVDVDRRNFGSLTAGAAAAVMLPEINIPSRVTSSDVRYLQAAVDSLYRQDNTVGGVVLLCPALRQWRRARRMLKESSCAEETCLSLLRVAGDLALFGGWLAFDSDNVPLARRLSSEAQLLASSAGDDLLTAQALRQLSVLAAFTARMGPSGDPAREAMRLTNQAAEEARYERMPGLHARIALDHADAASLLGDKAAFRSAIGRARRELDRGPRTDEPEFARRTSESGITAMEAFGHLALGEPSRSEELYRGLLDGDLPPLGRACYGTQLSLSLLGQGAQGEAIAEGMNVLPAFEGGLTSLRVLRELRPVRVAARRADAEEFCARYDAVDRALAAA